MKLSEIVENEVIIKNDLNVEEYNYLREEVNWNKKNPDFIKFFHTSNRY